MNKRKARFWITAPVLVGAALFALAFFIAAAAKTPGRPAAKQASDAANPSSAIHSQAYEGMISDTHCGAKHSAAIGLTASDCTRVCVHGGEQFALVDGETVYLLQGEPAALKRVAGQRVRIDGVLDGNKISVESVKAI